MYIGPIKKSITSIFKIFIFTMEFPHLLKAISSLYTYIQEGGEL
jgi:hypothetical protein